MSDKSGSLRRRLEDTGDFLLTFELVPGRTSKSKPIQKLMQFTEQAVEHGRLDALSLTDNPGGNPRLSPDALGRQLIKLGMDTIIHMTCRDANRLGLFSRAQQLEAIGVQNLLVLTGDYPSESDSGMAKPCFDLDSAALLCFLDQMNGRVPCPCMNIKTRAAEETSFFLGCAVSCTKYTEAEQLTQYYKLTKKIRNGARYVITQLGYDARKFHELIQFMRSAGLKRPVMGSVYILSEPAARFMNAGNVPGAVVSDRLYQAILEESHADDKGRKAALERSAKLIAVLKGLGYRGAHISGSATYEEIRWVIERFEACQDQWTEFVAEFYDEAEPAFYLYEKDQQTGLNRESRTAPSVRSFPSWLAFQCYEGFHKSVFNEKHPLFGLFKTMARSMDKTRGTRGLFHFMEHASKKVLFNCRMCGDCALADMGYVCPESKCAKYLRNGPCGGSSNGQCEVFPDRPCAWVTVYKRLRAVGRDSALRGACVPPRNWALDKTSSWINFYTGRDHHHVGSESNCAHP